MGGLDQVARVLLQLALAVAPGEVGIGLVEADLASSCIIAGRVNASARKITSGFFFFTAEISQCQKLSGLVCGLSTRKIVTPAAIQCRSMRRHSA